MSADTVTRFFVADTGLLWNVAVIDRLDLLEAFVTRTGRPPVWAEKVRSEVEDHVPGRLSDFDSIFGAALRPETPEEEGLVQRVQMLFFRGNQEGGGRHLGESQSIALCSRRYKSELVFMLTEDKRVRDFCISTRTEGSRHQREVSPQAWHSIVTRQLLSVSVREGRITEEQKLAYYEQLRAADRPLIEPK